MGLVVKDHGRSDQSWSTCSDYRSVHSNGSVFQLGVALADAQGHEPSEANCFRFDQVLADFRKLGLASLMTPSPPVLDLLACDPENPLAPSPRLTRQLTPVITAATSRSRQCGQPDL